MDSGNRIGRIQYFGGLGFGFSILSGLRSRIYGSLEFTALSLNQGPGPWVPDLQQNPEWKDPLESWFPHLRPWGELCKLFQIRTKLS